MRVFLSRKPDIWTKRKYINTVVAHATGVITGGIPGKNETGGTDGCRAAFGDTRQNRVTPCMHIHELREGGRRPGTGDGGTKLRN